MEAGTFSILYSPQLLISAKASFQNYLKDSCGGKVGNVVSGTSLLQYRNQERSRDKSGRKEITDCCIHMSICFLLGKIIYHTHKTQTFRIKLSQR
jgi:hypothetical protein